jgi:hypothetical protein
MYFSSGESATMYRNILIRAVYLGHIGITFSFSVYPNSVKLKSAIQATVEKEVDEGLEYYINSS